MLNKLRFISIALGIALGGALLTTSVRAQEGVKTSDDASNFKAFGEKAGLVNIMEDFMVNLLKDPRTKTFFENADQQRIKEQLVEQFCFILNGPCEYKGAKNETNPREHRCQSRKFQRASRATTVCNGQTQCPLPCAE